MKKIYLFLSLCLMCSVALAQFEGTIEFRMETRRDTTKNMYWVKGNHIKVEQYSKKTGKVDGCFVFDLAAKTIKFANPVRKVWGEHKNETPPVIKGKCEVTKTANTKVIQGKKCQEYVVKNVDENTIITYWITTEKLDFFVPMVKLWNRKDKASVYFNQIKDLPKGSMPLLSVETTLDGKPVGKLEVVKIEKKTIELSQVTVPPDYNRYQQN